MTQVYDRKATGVQEVALVPATPAPQIQLGTLAATTPDELLHGAAAIAKPLAKVIEDQKLYSHISGRRYVRVEGWTTLGAMLGVVAREVENVERDGTYIARVQLVRLLDGQVISEASAECGADEPMWQKRPAYARRSMAATRATGKACRLAFSWVMTMAGFEATPAEEMDGVVDVTPSASVPEVPVHRKATAKTITEGQQKRLFAIAKQHGWTAEDVRALVKREAGVEHTSEIKQGKWKGEYDALVQIIEGSAADDDAPEPLETEDDLLS